MWIKEAFETDNVLRGQELSAHISNVSVLFNWLHESIKYLNYYCLLEISYKLKVFVLSVSGLRLIFSIRRYNRSGMQPVKSVGSILDFDLKARVLPSLEREPWRARSSHPVVFCKKGILRNFAKIHGKAHVSGPHYLIKFQASACSFIKKRGSGTGVFLWI